MSVSASEQKKYREWCNSPEGKRQYLRKAYANGATTFDPDKYKLATKTTPDLDNIKNKALASVKSMFQGDIMDQEQLQILTRIAVALEAMVQASAPAAPNYQFPFEEYSSFDWQRINATIVAHDEYGATAVSWNGHTWKRRSWPQRYGLVIGFTRPDGMGEDGVNWLNLISFKEMKPVEPLDDKVTKALAGQRRQPSHIPVPTQAEPGTWAHVVNGGAIPNKYEHAIGAPILVIGKNDEKPGEVTEHVFASNGEPMYMVKVDGKEFKLSPDKIKAVQGEPKQPALIDAPGKGAF